jgi:membrane protein
LARSLTAPKPPQVEQPSPASLPDLRRKVIDAQVRLGRLTRSGSGGAELFLARMDLGISRFNALRPVRVFQLYLQRRGPLMAAGLAYRLFFAIAALLFVGFATFGLIIAGNSTLQSVVVDALDQSVPGLISRDGQEGLVRPEVLFQETGGFGVTLLISAAVMFAASLGWVSGMREAMRGIFALAPVVGNPVLIKLKDLGTLALLAVVMLVTTALSFLANNTLGALLALLHLSGASRVLTQLAGFAVMVILDTLVAVVLLHSASAIEMPRRSLLRGAIIAGIGSALLRTFSTLLLSGLGRNVILLQFAVILGLFIWFFFLSQVYLLATAWCAVSSADADGESERLHHAKAGTLRQRSRRKGRPSPPVS